MPSHDEIRARAHQLWEQAGKPDGQHHDFWHEAEQQLLDEELDQAARPDSVPDPDSAPAA